MDQPGAVAGPTAAQPGDRTVPLAVTLTTGVSPFGAQAVALCALSVWPHSSAKTIQAPERAATVLPPATDTAASARSRPMRDAAAFILRHGAHLGDRQDELVERASVC